MAITTELVLARHGQAVCNTIGIVGGETGCTGLSELGRQQVDQLARRLAAEHAERPFCSFYTTPRLRVRHSADIVSATLGLSAVIEPDLRGPDHGEADARHWRDVKAAFGGAPQHQPDQPIAPGAETWNAYLARACATLQRLLDHHSGQRILVLGHGETIEAANALLLRLPVNSSIGVWFTTHHAAITRWQHQVSSNGRLTWLLDTHNDVRHLTSPTR